MKIVIVYNRSAGSYSPDRVQRLSAALAARGHAILAGDCRDIDLHASLRDSDLLCIAGGDGTVRDLVAALPAEGVPPIAIYPMGTINLVAREAGFSADIERFADRISHPATDRLHYLGDVGGKPFLTCLSASPDSFAVAAMSPRIKRHFGRLAYLLAFLRSLLRWHRPQIRVTVDGPSHACEAAYVLKGRYYAGPWMLEPRADLRTGQFELLLLPRARRRDFLRLCLFAMVSRRFAHPDWIFLSATHFEIACDEQVPVQADGDIVTQLPVRIAINKRMLRFA